MNEVIHTILNRRSIRVFNDKPIDRETLQVLVDCALHAPSGMGKDTWYFAAINNKDLIDELIAIMQTVMDRKDYTMYHPSALIIAANKKDNSHGIEDNACALENTFIAASSLNIGSVWINQLRHYMDEPLLRDYLAKIGIDDSMNVYGIAAFGYYDQQPQEKIRKGTFNIYE